MDISSMLGVKYLGQFTVKGIPGRYRIGQWETGYHRIEERTSGRGSSIVWSRVTSSLTYDYIISVAPDGITALLLDEVMMQVKALIALGGRYLAKDHNGNVFCYMHQPTKRGEFWCNRGSNREPSEMFRVFSDSPVCEIVNFFDSEPMDLEKLVEQQDTAGIK